MQEREYFRAFRFGFGIDHGTAFDPANEVQAWKDNAASSNMMQQRFAALWEAQQRVKQSNRDLVAVEALKTLSGLFQNHDLHDAVTGAVQSPAMFVERLALFWSNHFSLGSGNAVVARLTGPHAAVLRSAMFGSFRELLEAAVLSPAMMQYLNLQQAIGPNSTAGKKNQKGLNENLGREILELHSLGVDGGYTQQDVAALSHLLTGWRFAPDSGAVSFIERRAEPGAKLLLGRSIGGSKPTAADLGIAFDVIAAHPATAHFIARKLVLHFMGPVQSDAVEKLVPLFDKGNGGLRKIYLALIEMAGRLQPKPTQFRNDAVFLISALRAMPLRKGVLEFQLRDNGRPKLNPATTGAFNNLRQKLWLAPSPAGWPDDPAYWMSASVMTARLRLIPRLAQLAKEQDPVAWAQSVLGPLLRPATRSAVALAPNRLQGMGLVLASPEFNRR